MTRKDYELVARVIRERMDRTERRRESVSSTDIRNAIGHELNAIEAVVIRLGESFAAENPRFDRGKFIHACAAAEIHAYGTVVRGADDQ